MTTPSPEVIQSPPPMTIEHIIEGPNPWFAFDAAIGVSGLGVAVAIVAVTVAVITLIMVCKQIKIANRQLRVAHEELKAVKSDFRLAQQEFDLAQKQFKEVTRRPQINVSLSLRRPQRTDFHWFKAQFAISNSGDMLAKDIMFELLVLEEDYQEAHGAANVTNDLTLLNGIPYRAINLAYGRPLYPNDVFKEVDLPSVLMKVGKSELLFRVYDERFAYPTDGYGKLEFKNQGTEPMVTVGYGGEAYYMG